MRSSMVWDHWESGGDGGHREGGASVTHQQSDRSRWSVRFDAVEVATGDRQAQPVAGGDSPVRGPEPHGDVIGTAWFEWRRVDVGLPEARPQPSARHEDGAASGPTSSRGSTTLVAAADSAPPTHTW